MGWGRSVFACWALAPFFMRGCHGVGKIFLWWFDPEFLFK
jgi:hypothetical protein